MSEALSIEHFPEFVRFREELSHWVAGDSSEERSLEATATALCLRARELGLLPEHLLLAMRGGQDTPPLLAGTDPAARRSQARAQRYRIATGLLLRCYFA